MIYNLPMKRLALLTLIAAACMAQTPSYTTVTIQVNTGQQPFAGWYGVLRISSPIAVGTPAASIGTWAQTYQITNSQPLSIGLAPNDTMVPANRQYIFQFTPNQNNGAAWTQYCTVPTSGSAVTYQTICMAPGVNPSIPPVFNAVSPLVWNVALARISCPTCSVATSTVSSVFTRTGAVTAQTGDYTAAQVTNAVSTLGSYADPAWITALNAAKLTGTPSATLFWYSDGSGHPVGDSLVAHIVGGFALGTSAGGLPFSVTNIGTALSAQTFITPTSGSNTSMYLHIAPMGSGASRLRLYNGPDINNAGLLSIQVQGGNAVLNTRVVGAGTPITTFQIGETAGGGGALTSIPITFLGLTVASFGPNGFYVGLAPTGNTMEIASPTATTGITRVFVRQGAADTSASTLFTVNAWVNAVSGYKINGAAAATTVFGTSCTLGGSCTPTVPAVNLPAPGATCTFAANSTICVATTTATITVPVPVAGYQFCAMNDDNVSTVITLLAIGSSARYENTARTAYGSAGTGTFVSGGAVGDMVCIIGRDSTHYLTPSFKGTWTAN